MNKQNLESLLIDRSRTALEWSVPIEFDLNEAVDHDAIALKLQRNEIRSVYDPIDAIANDLYELRYPHAKVDEQKRIEFVADIKQQGLGYGKWFHFPWLGELVRYPNREDHRALRTSRNRNLITDAEQQNLYDARVAVFGLSVGSNVVERLVSSGIGGTIIMGDFDRIDPSNLNRIDGGLPDVGAKKLHHMARKISLSDPYIRQVHFEDGVSKVNLEELKTYAPDILFDEVDDLNAKASLRRFAQRNGIPVVMATDLGDRSLIDVERYDLGKVEPFNGRLKSEEVDKLCNAPLTPAEKAHLTAKIVGMRHVTTRMLASVMEIDKSLSGLPQLGATAAMGSALGAMAAREILLGRKLESGRYVCSPKEIMDLGPQASPLVWAKTVATFLKAKKQQ